jgi:hypothetical protein
MLAPFAVHRWREIDGGFYCEFYREFYGFEAVSRIVGLFL